MMKKENKILITISKDNVNVEYIDRDNKKEYCQLSPVMNDIERTVKNISTGKIKIKKKKQASTIKPIISNKLKHTNKQTIKIKNI